MYMGYKLLFCQTSGPIVQRKVVVENEYGRRPFIEILKFKNLRTRLPVELEKRTYQPHSKQVKYYLSDDVDLRHCSYCQQIIYLQLEIHIHVLYNFVWL